MIGSRLKKLAIVAGAGAVATASTLALNPFSASAADTTTTTTVTVSTQATSGQPVRFTAKVTPSKTTGHPVTRASGTVTFKIVGADSSSVACAGGNSSPALNATGHAYCKVSAGVLTAAASPYTVTATYSGGSGFATSSGTMSETIGLAPTKVKVTVDAAPTSTTASTFTATVTGPDAAVLPTGTVTFAIFADNQTRKKDLRCTGLHRDSELLTPSATTPPTATATCNLVAGWVKLPKATKTDPNPSSQWGVTAVYSGSTTFEGGSGTKSGIATS